MSIAKILVPVDGGDKDLPAITAALQAARLFNSHVRVLAVHPEPANAIPNVGVPLTAEAMRAVIDGQVGHAAAINRRVRDALSTACTAEGARLIADAERGADATASFRHTVGDFESVVARAASLSDLVVFGPRRRGADDSALTASFLRVLERVHTPVLIANDQPSGRLRKIVIGWDESMVAAYAIRRAIPFLRHAEQVLVLHVDQPGRTATLMGELGAYLTRNDIAFEYRALCSEGAALAEMLCSEAAMSRADLLVAGGYGHDHLREAFLGGATQSLLAQRDIPLFLAH
jgi:nucleotide-binding universal stress UspA family protein